MWSYPTYPPPIQSELFYTALEKCRAKSQKMLGAFKPPDTPSARAVCVRTRPQRGHTSWGLFHPVSCRSRGQSTKYAAKTKYRYAISGSFGSVWTMVIKLLNARWSTGGAKRRSADQWVDG